MELWRDLNAPTGEQVDVDLRPGCGYAAFRPSCGHPTTSIVVVFASGKAIIEDQISSTSVRA